jgi:putative flippase GtrA
MADIDGVSQRYARQVSRPAIGQPPPSATGGSNPLRFVRRVYDRFEGLLREIGKFGTVGAVCYLVDITVFNILRVALGEPILPKIISTVIATTLAFVGNRFWTWRDRSRSGLTREYPLFFGVNLVGLGIGVACLWISHTWLGSYWPVFASGLADNISANVVGMSLSTLFRFWAYRRFVFRAVTVSEP